MGVSYNFPMKIQGKCIPEIFQTINQNFTFSRLRDVCCICLYLIVTIAYFLILSKYSFSYLKKKP